MSRTGQLLRRCTAAVFICAALGAQQQAADASGHGTAAPAASALTITPNGGPPGSLVTLTAPPRSLPAGAVAVVNFQDATAAYPGVPIGQNRVSADGSLNIPVNVLGTAAAGPARIFVTANGVTISSLFTIQPGLAINPPSAPRGSVVQVTGSGFTSNALITIQVGDQPATALDGGSIIANIFGSFTTYLVIPRLPPGLVVMTVGDSTLTATAPFLVTDGFGPPTPLPSVTLPVTGTITIPPGATATPTAASIPAATASPAPGAGTTAYFAEGYTGQASFNGPAGFDESLNILNPGSDPATVTLTYYVQGAASPTIVARTVTPGSVLRESVNADVGPDRMVAAQVSSPGRVFVSRTITRIAPSGARLDGSTTQPVAAPSTSWGFPEGYTGFTFQEYLTLLNPGQTAASVLITLAPQADTSVGAHVLRLTVPPQSRVTANITALNRDSSAKSVGMLLTSDLPIVAERVIYFGDGAGSAKFGSTVSSGIGAPGTTLRIAGLASGGAASQPIGDQAYITLLNPATAGIPVNVTAAFADAAGHAVGGPVTVSVAPGTRRTISVNPALGSAPVGPVSATLTAAGPIEAEAAQYFGGSPNTGAHPGIALPARAADTVDAFLPDLSTALRDGTPITRTVYLYNPGNASIEVSASYFGAGGTPVHASYAVPAGGITTVAVNADAGALGRGPLGGEFQEQSGSGPFLASSVGRAADGLIAFEDISASMP